MPPSWLIVDRLAYIAELADFRQVGLSKLRHLSAAELADVKQVGLVILISDRWAQVSLDILLSLS